MQSKSPSITKCSLLIIILMVSSCATQEDIERKELVYKLKGDMSGQQNITKSLLLKINNIENNLGIVSGKVETAQHNLEVTEQNTIDDLKRVESIEKDHKQYVIDTNAEISKLHKEIKNQKSYLKKLLKELKSISSGDGKKNLSLFSESIINYQQKKYKDAKGQFLRIVNDIDTHQLNQRDQALVFHNLAMTFFIEKDYKNSQIYFSKLFTNYEKSPLNSSGTLPLRNVLQKTKQSERSKGNVEYSKNQVSKFKVYKVSKKKKVISENEKVLFFFLLIFLSCNQGSNELEKKINYQ